jgi:hypothetical protein
MIDFSIILDYIFLKQKYMASKLIDIYDTFIIITYKKNSYKNLSFIIAAKIFFFDITVLVINFIDSNSLFVLITRTVILNCY